MNYRWLYEKHNGKIPLDEYGRSYDIHHIDGNHANNTIENLKCVTIQEHYDIHYSQGDYGACLRIAARMDKTHEQLSELASMNNKKRVKNGTNPFLNGEISRRTQKKKVEEGTHPFLNGENARKTQLKRIEDKIHPFCNSEFQSQISKENNKKRIEAGMHNFLNGKSTKQQLLNGSHVSQKEYICPYCNKIGKGGGMFSRHFDNCKLRIV